MPDSQFPKDGKGATSEIPYHKLFSQYKLLFVNNWDTPYVLNLVGKVNQRVFGKTKASLSSTATMNEEDFTTDIDAAMAAMAMGLPDSESPDSEFQDTGSSEPTLGLSFGAVVEIVSSNDVAGNEQALVALQVPDLQAGELEALTSLHSEMGEVLDNPKESESVSVRGRGKARDNSKQGNKSKVAMNGAGAVTRSTRHSTAKYIDPTCFKINK